MVSIIQVSLTKKERLIIILTNYYKYILLIVKVINYIGDNGIFFLFAYVLDYWYFTFNSHKTILWSFM